MFKYFVLVYFCCSVPAESSKRWHTSQVGLSKLYELQKEHFDAFNGYFDVESKRLEGLKNVLAEWRQHTSVNADKMSYLRNHINGVSTTNRIYYQLRRIEELTNNAQSVAVLNVINNSKDLSGDHILLSFQGLRRIQRFYAIPATEMAAGRYGTRVIGDQMDACECYVMSGFCFEAHDMGCTADWAIQAYEKWTNNGQPNCLDIETLKFYIRASSIFVGFDFKAFLNSKLTRHSEENENFSQHFSLMRKEVFNRTDIRTLDIFDSVNSDYYEGAEVKFKDLCRRGQSNRTLTKYLKCRYQTKNSLYRLLMPFKEEDIEFNPLIKIYHDVLYDGEIEKVKEKVTPKFRDAEVRNSTGGNILIETSRSGQVSWIEKNDEGGYFDSLNSRIECFTELSLKTAEAYQIVNYGLSGHYVPHHDAFKKQYSNTEKGNRIMTVLFYLTDVPNDGFTSFPMLNIIAPVEKGSALMWYGLHTNNGSLYTESLHGSCPILKGNKWIMTKWLYEEGQPLPYDWKNTT